jgi:hypothetical protein
MKFLHDLLATMVKQHGEQAVLAQLTQLHAKMSVSKKGSVAKKEEKVCNRCGGFSGSPHYCM